MTNSIVQILFNGKVRDGGREGWNEKTVTTTWVPVPSCWPFLFLLSGGGPQSVLLEVPLLHSLSLGIQTSTCCCHDLEWHVCKQLLPFPQFATMGAIVRMRYPDLPPQPGIHHLLHPGFSHSLHRGILTGVLISNFLPP